MNDKEMVIFFTVWAIGVIISTIFLNCVIMLQKEEKETSFNEFSLIFTISMFGWYAIIVIMVLIGLKTVFDCICKKIINKIMRRTI